MSLTMTSPGSLRSSGLHLTDFEGDDSLTLSSISRAPFTEAECAVMRAGGLDMDEAWITAKGPWRVVGCCGPTLNTKPDALISGPFCEAPWRIPFAHTSLSGSTMSYLTPAPVRVTVINKSTNPVLDRSCQLVNHKLGIDVKNLYKCN